MSQQQVSFSHDPPHAPDLATITQAGVTSTALAALPAGRRAGIVVAVRDNAFADRVAIALHQAAERDPGPEAAPDRRTTTVWHTFRRVRRGDRHVARVRLVERIHLHRNRSGDLTSALSTLDS
jgi:hypothetical protein